MQTIGIVLNVGRDQVDAFERGFREMEAPIWARSARARPPDDGHPHAARHQHQEASRALRSPWWSPSSRPMRAITSTTTIPRFEAWNKRADTYQVAEPFVFGGDSIVTEGP